MAALNIYHKAKQGHKMKTPKTPPYQKKANDAYVKRHGYVQYNRKIKPEWKEALDELLAKLRQEVEI